MIQQSFYVSITGLKVRSWKYIPAFWWHAVRSKIQADRAPGILFVGVKKINGVHHTLTAWQSREAMKSYIMSGSHKRAMPVFHKIATGQTFGFEASRLPDWDEVHRLWREHGKDALPKQD